MRANVVDVLLPIHSARYLRETLESLHLNRDFLGRLIVHIDNSEAAIKSTLAEYKKKFDLVILTSDHARGPSFAINKAFEECSARYVMLMSHDDVLTEDFFKERIAALGAGNSAAITIPDLLESADNAATYSPFKQEFQTDNSLAIFADLFADGNFLCMPGTLLKREVLEEYGSFTEFVLGLQDFEFWLWFFGSRKVAAFFRGGLQYRLHDQNLSQFAAGRIPIEYAIAVRRAVRRLDRCALKSCFPSLQVLIADNLPVDLLSFFALKNHLHPLVRIANLTLLLSDLCDPVTAELFTGYSNLTVHDLHNELAETINELSE